MFLLLFFSRFGKYLHNIFSNIFMLHSIFILEILCLLYSVIISKIVPDYIPFFVNVFSLFLRLNNLHLTNLLTLSSTIYNLLLVSSSKIFLLYILLLSLLEIFFDSLWLCLPVEILPQFIHYGKFFL